MNLSKKILAISSSLVLMTYSVNAIEQKFDVPDYNLSGAEKSVKYFINTPFGFMETNASVDTALKVEVYFVDRNNDKKHDLAHEIVTYPKALTGLDKEITEISLYIDEDFDGFVERRLIDFYDKNEKEGADGIFDEEEYMLRINDLK